MTPFELHEISAARTRKERVVLYILATLFAVVLLVVIVAMLVEETARS